MSLLTALLLQLLSVSLPQADAPSELHWRACLLGQTKVQQQCQGALQQFDWHQAKAEIYRLKDQGAWRLPTADELSSLIDNAPEVLAKVSDQWLLSASVLRHGNELLVAAVHYPSGKVEYIPVREPALVLLVEI
ncbi:hypothetical protein PSI9734_02137 [Pseudidiomarina piscicola]|uniref:DUF1566 domain-containing protein n=1 Tax=Pseudidiomarina piscicola TaxID=2614830 RepID=A0A6S6WLU2_9GAMM|nr:hypothetical protein [Pseudidiomarina piscicola]CAB0151770.1 hypothetical protein PSI9734_02137 [Pseudidiomarina piscicola]VZT41224.1 hypothetical protein PSI9734_02137 [Pseudomonas aeruginosa]